MVVNGDGDGDGDGVIIRHLLTVGLVRKSI